MTYGLNGGMITPACGLIGNFSPASLGTVKDGEASLQNWSTTQKENSKGYIQFFDADGKDIGAINKGDKRYGNNQPTYIRFGQTRCETEAGSQEITKSTTQVEGGIELVTDASGSYVRNSAFQAAREKSVKSGLPLPKLNGLVPEEAIFSSNVNSMTIK